MYMQTIYKIIIAVVVLFVVVKYLAPILTGFFPPFGVIILILIFLAIVAWLMGWFPLP